MKTLLISLILVFSSLGLSAQTVIYNSQITSVTQEDGRRQWIKIADKKPLKGKYKVLQNPHRQDTYILVALKNGYKEGVEETYRSGYLESHHEFKNGVLDGTTRYYYQNGSVEKEFNYKKGQQHGKEVVYFKDGTIRSETNYKDGLPDGRMYAYSYDYETYGGDKVLIKDKNYVAGKAHGKQFEIRSNSNTDSYSMEWEYDNGTMLSYKEKYIPGGELKREIIDGVQINYYKSGAKESEMRYSDPNTLNGEQRYYYENGQLERVANYINNYEEGELKEYYPDGTLKLEEYYEKGWRSKPSVEYYPNGQKQAEWSYRGIHRTGPFKLYYDDGALKEEGEADYDSYVWRKVYYRNGQLKLYWIVSNGVLNEVESYNEDGSQN